ncbi:MAG: type II toxin-antitoxin system HicA family toxin [Betaproteobacteria bacterium]|nr:type II toxin-antitoxin system HicA family toxin [Betaproteobacteria bacterium]
MNSKHAKTLKALFAKPTASNIKFADIEALVMGLGGDVREGDGSRVALLLNGGVKHAHRPHPGKEAKQYQVREIKEWLIAQRYTNP